MVIKIYNAEFYHFNQSDILGVAAALLTSYAIQGIKLDYISKFKQLNSLKNVFIDEPVKSWGQKCLKVN